MGILTGKYTQNYVPPNFQSWRYNRSYLKKIEPLLKELQIIGDKHSGKTPGQVSLKRLISKGVVAIPGAKDVTQ
jgi:aryl-alcohol dehydrogenase-like predicted oxidoreductase